MDRAHKTGDEFYLDSVALNLHSFYTALERIFELVASNVDRTRIKSDNWHQELLQQMMLEIKLVRPPVISKEVRNSLDEFRGFRHVVRNVYSFHLSPSKMEPLVNKLPEMFIQIKEDIEHFLLFLETRGM